MDLDATQVVALITAVGALGTGIGTAVATMLRRSTQDWVAITTAQGNAVVRLAEENERLQVDLAQCQSGQEARDARIADLERHVAALEERRP